MGGGRSVGGGESTGAGSALTLEVKLGGGHFGAGRSVGGGGQISTHFGSKLEGVDRLGVWIGTHFGSEFGGCVLGAGLVGGELVGGGLPLTLEVKLGGGIGGISCGWIGRGQISTYFGSEYGGAVCGGPDLFGVELHSL